MSKNIKTARDFSRELKKFDVEMSSQNAARYFRENPPAMTLKFIGALCNLFCCSVDDLFSNQHDVHINKNSDKENINPNNEKSLLKRSSKLGPRSKLF